MNKKLRAVSCKIERIREMTENKIKNVSFKEFAEAVAVIANGAFVNDVFNATSYELFKRVVPIQVYVPSFDTSDVNVMWGEEAEKIIKQLKKNKQYKDMLRAADNQIMHRLRGIECSTFSATDVTLSKLLTVLRERVENEKEVDMETVNRFLSAVEAVNKPEFKANVIAALERDNSEVSEKS